MSKKVKVFLAKVKSIDVESKTATVVISSGSVDRYNEVVRPDALMKNIGIYMKHPILLSAHRQDFLTRQIGAAKNIGVNGNDVEATFEWYAGQGNAEADWGWFLAQKGIAAFSIGFIANAWEIAPPEDKKAGIDLYYTDIEVLEVSQVLIPANRDSVQNSAEKGDGVEKELCGMAIKSLDLEKDFPVKENKGVATSYFLREAFKAADCQQVIKDAIKDHIGSVLASDETKALLRETIEASLKENKKHYSEILLGPVAPAPIAVPTKAVEVDVAGEVQKAIGNILKKE